MIITDENGAKLFETVNDEPIGTGSLGKVYKAKVIKEENGKIVDSKFPDGDRVGKQVTVTEVALKMLRDDLKDSEGRLILDNQDITAKFCADGVSLSQVKHPYQVRVYKADKHKRDDGKLQPYVAMTLMEETLARRLSTIIDTRGQKDLLGVVKNRIWVADALEMIMNLGVYLSYLHSQDKLHGDFRPENILLSKTAFDCHDPCLGAQSFEALLAKSDILADPQKGIQGILHPGEVYKVSDLNTHQSEKLSESIWFPSGYTQRTQEKGDYVKRKHHSPSNYCHPEFTESGGSVITPQTDLYMLGQVAIELLTLIRPGTRNNTIYPQHNPTLSNEVIKVLKKAVATAYTDPTYKPDQTVSEFVSELETAIKKTENAGQASYFFVMRKDPKEKELGYHVGGPLKKLVVTYGSKEQLTSDDVKTIFSSTSPTGYLGYLSHADVPDQEKSALANFMDSVLADVNLAYQQKSAEQTGQITAADEQIRKITTQREDTQKAHGDTLAAITKLGEYKTAFDTAKLVKKEGS